MILIDEIRLSDLETRSEFKIENESILIRFYNGIDFNMIKNHPKDGSNGFICFFIDKWETEVKKQERDNKISSIIGEEFDDTDINEIDNNYVFVYETDGNMEIIYKAIRKKIENGNFINIWHR